VRRLEIRRLVEEHDAIPSCRKLQRLLLAAGIRVGHVTVMTDLRLMQLADTLGPQREPNSWEESLDASSPAQRGPLGT
jgi:hypothetical protein